MLIEFRKVKVGAHFIYKDQKYKKDDASYGVRCGSRGSMSFFDPEERVEEALSTHYLLSFGQVNVGESFRHNKRSCKKTSASGYEYFFTPDLRANCMAAPDVIVSLSIPNAN